MPAATDRRIADDELLISRRFNAPLSLVWRLWEDPDHMRRWWGPEDFHIRALSSDFRPGGKWRVHMWSERYGDSFSSGEWRSMERPDRLTFTFAWQVDSGEPTETLVTVTFEEHDGRTTLQHFHQAPFSSVESRDSHILGWNSLFNKEQRYAEAVARGEDPPAL